MTEGEVHNGRRFEMDAEAMECRQGEMGEAKG
jgi:hypothetical protein